MLLIPSHRPRKAARTVAPRLELLETRQVLNAHFGEAVAMMRPGLLAPATVTIPSHILPHHHHLNSAFAMRSAMSVSAPARHKQPSGLGQISPATTTGTFVGVDTTTHGTWSPTYGADGSYLVGGASNLPAYATLTPIATSYWTWASSTSDTRVLQTAAGSSSRAANTWYSGYNFSVAVNLNDGNSHKVSLYTLDYDSSQRSERR